MTYTSRITIVGSLGLAGYNKWAVMLLKYRDSKHHGDMIGEHCNKLPPYGDSSNATACTILCFARIYTYTLTSRESTHSKKEKLVAYFTRKYFNMSLKYHEFCAASRDLYVLLCNFMEHFSLSKTKCIYVYSISYTSYTHTQSFYEIMSWHYHVRDPQPILPVTMSLL